jgi:hypothetical protein
VRETRRAYKVSVVKPEGTEYSGDKVGKAQDEHSGGQRTGRVCSGGSERNKTSKLDLDGDHLADTVSISGSSGLGQVPVVGSHEDYN